MISIRELSKKTGISTRMLRYYDRQEVLKPAYYAENGQRIYEDDAILRLQQIVAFQHLGYDTGEIRKMLDEMEPGSGAFETMLERQIELLEQEERRIHRVLEMLQKVKGQCQKGDYSLEDIAQLIQVSSTDRRILSAYQEEKQRRSRVDYHNLDGTSALTWVRELFEQMHIPERAAIAEIDAESVNLWKGNEHRLPKGQLDLYYWPGTEIERQDLISDDFHYNWYEYTDSHSLPAKQYDIIVDNYCAIHGDQIENWLDGVVKAIKDGGRFYAVVTDGEHKKEIHRWVGQIDASAQGEQERRAAVFGVERAKALLEERFEKVRIVSYPEGVTIRDVDGLMDHIRSLLLYRKKNEGFARQERMVRQEIEEIMRREGCVTITDHHYFIEATGPKRKA